MTLPVAIAASDFADLKSKVKDTFKQNFSPGDSISFFYNNGLKLQETPDVFAKMPPKTILICLNETRGEMYDQSRPTPTPASKEVISFFELLASTDVTQEEVTVTNSVGKQETFKQDVLRFLANDQPCMPIPIGCRPKVRGIFIRDKYKPLSDEIIATNARFLHLGNPGIGKSFFGLFLIKELIKQKKRFFYEPNAIETNYDVYFYDPDANNKLVQFSRSQLQAFTLYDFYIVDGHAPLLNHMRTILIVSPRGCHYGEFKKCQNVKTRYMSLWTLDELKKCRHLLYLECDEAKMLKIFEKWGGFVRYAIEQAITGSEDNIDFEFIQGINKCNVEILKKYLFKQSFIEQVDELSNRIILIEIISYNKETEVYQLNFSVTNHAAQLIWERLKNNSKDEILKVIRQVEMYSTLSNVFSELYEPLCHEILAKGGKFYARKLVKTGENPCEAEISFPALTAKDLPFTKIDTVGMSQEEKKLKITNAAINLIEQQPNFNAFYYKCPKNFPTIDAFAYCNYKTSPSDDSHARTYQITIQKDAHSNNITFQSKAVLCSLVNKEKDLHVNQNGGDTLIKIRQYTVLPPAIFDKTFKETPFADNQTSDMSLEGYFNEHIEQWALKLIY